MADSLGGILTKGLGSNSTAFIIAPWNLKLVITVEDKGGGKSRVSGGGIYPVDTDHLEEEPKKNIYISVKLGNKIIEKNYLVSKNRSDKIVNIVNILNKTTENFNLTVNKFRKVVHNITVKFIKKN